MSWDLFFEMSYDSYGFILWQVLWDDLSFGFVACKDIESLTKLVVSDILSDVCEMWHLTLTQHWGKYIIFLKWAVCTQWGLNQYKARDIGQMFQACPLLWLPLMPSCDGCRGLSFKQMELIGQDVLMSDQLNFINLKMKISGIRVTWTEWVHSQYIWRQQTVPIALQCSSCTHHSLYLWMSCIKTAVHHSAFPSTYRWYSIINNLPARDWIKMVLIEQYPLTFTEQIIRLFG